VSDLRTAEPEPVALSGFAPRADPAPDRSPAVRGGEYLSQGYGSGQDHRAMDRRGWPADYAGLPQDRPARGSLPELRMRLLRLPAGHPSSPYDDRGVLRPDPQQLRQLELPLADEERDSEPSARASLLAIGSADREPAAPLALPEPDDEPTPASPPPADPAPNGSVANGSAPNGGAPNGGAPNGSAPNTAGAAQRDDPPARDAMPASAWLTSQNGSLADISPGGRPGRVGSSPYGTDLDGTHRGNGAGARNGAAAHQGNGADPYDTPPAGDEPRVRNGRTDAFSTDWPGLDTNGNGHPANGGPAPAPASGGPGAGAPHDGTAERLPARRGPSGLAVADRGAARLTPEQEAIADQALAKYLAADGRNMFGGYGESGLTPAMRRVEANLPHGRLAPDSEENSLKSPERYKEKLARMIARSPGVPVEELAAEIYDAARYTFVFEPQDYTDGTWLVHRRLKAQGFELEARRNRWDSPEFKGIRTRWRDPAHDLAFEVQFHTPSSWDVVRRTHEAYLRITDPQAPPAERAQLRARQAAAAAGAQPPPRHAEITDFRTDVR
jgi:hypothetical protein